VSSRPPKVPEELTRSGSILFCGRAGWRYPSERILGGAGGSLALNAGSRLGPYEIVAIIGSGGMGEVYRAMDTRLNRTVAIKVLPPSLATRLEHRQRFETEARAISSLNHPHICALYDIGCIDNVDYMVMEFLEGESLAERLTRGPLPFAEALRFAGQIAEALEQAHQHGVTHRDLKPGNVVICRSGVKLLDFGLARLQVREGLSSENAPTVATTREGMILGTPQYMSPEQIDGGPVDARTDIFAFGSVLYEMLTGRKAFAGESLSLLMAAVARAEHAALPGDFPPALQYLLQRCWRRPPEERWQSIADVRALLDFVATASPGRAAQAIAVMSRREAIAWGAAALLGGTAAVEWIRGKPAPESMRGRFTIAAPRGLSVNLFGGNPALSPDGRSVVLCASRGGKPSLWIRKLDSTEMMEIPDTENAGNPFWSPDSRWLGFYASGKLRKVPVSGGPSQVICDAEFGLGGEWSEEEKIIFQNGVAGVLHEVSAQGGTSSPLIPGNSENSLQAHPCLLPGGRTVLFAALNSDPERSGVYALSLGSSTPQRILAQPVKVRYGAGRLLFYQAGKLAAQQFDPQALRLQGDAFTIAADVWNFQGIGRFDVAGPNALIYAHSDTVTSQLTWFERNGRPLQSVGPTGPFVHADLSRDETVAVVERYEGGVGELWIVDMARGVPTPVTFAPDWAYGPYWSPDGSHFVYALSALNNTRLVQREAGGGQPRPVIDLGLCGPSAPSGWSPDGRNIVYSYVDLRGNQSLLILPVDGEERQPIAYAPTPAPISQARFSPDGKWMVYVSNESNMPEIYVAPFPNPTSKWRISTSGGVQPRWRADGKEIFYIAPDRTLMAVPVPGTPDRAGVPVPLFKTQALLYYGGLRNDYVPSSDGKRFLINNQIGEPAPQTFDLILSWTDFLKA
jgi:hypothetical protein